MARSYRKPMMNVEKFVANEYVAACGDENRVYKFVCNAPAGTLYYYKKGDGAIDGQYTGTGSATYLGWSYHPCKAEHEASVTSDFYDGFVDYNYNGKHDAGEGVIVWRGPKNNDGHATMNLNMDSWETAKS